MSPIAILAAVRVRQKAFYPAKYFLADRIRILRLEKEQLRRREKVLHHAAVTDGLTGLFNRRFLLESLETESGRARSANQPLSLMILDVDDFKRFNDTHGHPEGDKVLVALARILVEQLRDKDRPCRYGGEEFVAVLPQTGLIQALASAERIRTAMAGVVFHPAQGVESCVTVSIGVAELALAEDGKEMLRRADQALYQAKRSGKNVVISA